MRKNLFQDALEGLLGNPAGTRITDSETGERKDTGVQAAMETLVHFLSTGIIKLSEPLIIQSNVTNGPAIQILNAGGSNQGITIINEDLDYVTLGIGVGSQGIVANEFIPHPAWVIDGEGSLVGFGNTGYQVSPAGYGQGSGSVVPDGGSTGATGQIGGGGGGSGATTEGSAGISYGPGIAHGLGPYGTPGGLGTNGQQIGTGSPVADPLNPGIQPTGYSANAGNPSRLQAPFSPPPGLAMMLLQMFQSGYMQYTRPTLLGKTDATHNKSASGVISIYGVAADTIGSETDTGDNITAYNRYGNLAISKWVHIQKGLSGWEIIAAEC